MSRSSPLRVYARRRSFWVCALLISPVGVHLEVPSDSVIVEDEEFATQFRFGAGTGGYARAAEVLVGMGSTSGCEGEQSFPITKNVVMEDKFYDAGFSLEHAGSKIMHIGLRGGFIWETATLSSSLSPVRVDTSQAVFYGNPYVRLDGKYIGIGIGAVVASKALWKGDTVDYPGEEVSPDVQPSFQARLGSTFFLSYELWSQVPLYSGGGQHLFGIGLKPKPRTRLFAGMSQGPYTKEYVMLKLDLPVGRQAALHLGTHLPYDYNGKDAGDADEFSATVGFSWYWGHIRPYHRRSATETRARSR